MKKKISKIQLTRNIIQLFGFIMLPGLFVESFMGIKSLVQGLAAGDYEGIMPALVPTVLLILITMLFGRVFCGYICAFGTMGDAANYIGRKVFKIKFTMPEKADSILKWLKYVILIILIMLWILGKEISQSYNPWNAFGILAQWLPDFTYAFNSMFAGTILLIIIIVASMFIDRFFCRYLCPMGAVFSVASKLRIFRISKPVDEKKSCTACTRNCKMGIQMRHKDVIDSGECIQCMKCTESCYRDNVNFTVGKKIITPFIAAIIAVSTIGMYYLSNNAVSKLSEMQNTAVAEETYDDNAVTIDKADNSVYNDGIYEGSGIGYRGQTTTLSVTIENDQIVSIQTVSTSDDDKFYNSAYSTVTASILSAQSTAVDTVSGATYSSNGIIDAVADALTQAEK